MKNNYIVIINDSLIIECSEGELSSVISTTTKYMSIRTIDITLKSTNELKEEIF